MKYKIIFLSMVLIFLLSINNINAFMPKFSHKYITDRALEQPIDSEFYRACMKYPKLCFSGVVLNDVSVIFYYTARGKYTATHNPPFCKELIDNIAKIPNREPERMRACAIGGCIHQPQDIPSHSLINNRDGMVAYSITHSLLMNNIIHVFAEQKLDNYVERKDFLIGKESEDYLLEYKECQDLFTVALMGEPAYSGMSQEELDKTFETFITEVRNSQDTGYNPGFENKSFFVTIQSIPFVILGSYIAIMLGFLLLSILLIFKIIKGDRRIRVWVGLLIFIPIASILIYLFISSLQGSVFNNFINLIKPVSELVPLGGDEEYLNAAIENTRALLLQGPTWLEGTDASGLSTNPVLINADSRVINYDYLILILLVVSLVWFIWFLFKKNKLINKGGFNL